MGAGHKARDDNGEFGSAVEIPSKWEGHYSVLIAKFVDICGKLGTNSRSESR